MGHIQAKVVALFWCVAFFGVSYGIFTYSPESRPWWLTGLAFLASFLAFGALLEFFKARAGESASGAGVVAGGLTDRENDLVGRYGQILEKRAEIVGRESDLPAPAEQLRRILLKAQQDPIYRLDPGSVGRCLRMLDTYVPDEEYESTRELVGRALERGAARDEAGFTAAIETASPRCRLALEAVVDTMVRLKERR